MQWKIGGAEQVSTHKKWVTDPLMLILIVKKIKEGYTLSVEVKFSLLS